MLRKQRPSSCACSARYGTFLSNTVTDVPQTLQNLSIHERARVLQST